MNRDWIVRPYPRPEASLRLVCFPYAGGGAAIYQRWSCLLPSNIDVCAIQLPGRENRFREKPCMSWETIVQETVVALKPYLDRPIALFGYSLGAILAYETAQYLQQVNCPPSHLFVAARVAPAVRDQRQMPMHTLSDAQFVDKLLTLGGTSNIVLQNEELMALYLPILRADFYINETYIRPTHSLLTCPISAFHGDNDDLMTYNQVAQWQNETTDNFNIHTFQGGHFFIHDRLQLLINSIQQYVTVQV